MVPIGHFLENTAILRAIGGALSSKNWRRFHENSAKRRSPDQALALARVVHMDVFVGVWRRKRAGSVKRTMKKRVMQRLKLKGELDFFGLLLKAMSSTRGSEMLSTLGLDV